jgi:N-methylhydantoinase A
MGGTSTDITLIDDGQVTVTREATIGGLPVALPMIDIETIGAGGGSIAFVDGAGALKVGPRSAGADPGPACYGRSLLPTVTDANLLLGRLEPSWFLGGRMELDARRSRQAFAALAPRGKLMATARAALDIALSHMEAAVKRVSLERGQDPRDFALVAYGGAGPMHACELAARLEIPRVLVPVHPGLFSSMGMLLADAGRDYTRTVLCSLDGSSGMISGAFARLERQAAVEMKGEGFARRGLRFSRSLGMRYAGQSHELEIAVTDLGRESVLRHFEDTYRSAYGFLRDPSDIEIVNIRLSCRSPHRDLPVAPGPSGRQRAVPVARRPIDFGGKKMSCDVFARTQIAAGQAVSGPALIVQADATTVVPPGWRCALDMMGNLDIEALR